MRRQHYTIILYSLYLGAIIYGLCFLGWHYLFQTEDKSQLAPKYYDDVVTNQNTSFTALSGNPTPYELSFIKIRSISFYSDNDFVYLRFFVGGTIPENVLELPNYSGDKIKSVSYDMTLDENYFDFQGNKNPGGPEANLKIDMYGTSQAENSEGKINVNGELIKGGPGFDYFVVRYPYRDVLFNQQVDYIVFTSSARVTSEKYPEGATKFEFYNSSLAATKQNNKEVKIDLTLKSVTY